MKQQSPKDLEKVGVYGFVTYDDSGESVLANNPDLSTDAGQFAMIEAVSPSDKKLRFEFIAAIPKETVKFCYCWFAEHHCPSLLCLSDLSFLT